MTLTKRSSSQKSKTSQHPELLYVHIKSPLEIRREVLLASKDALDLLRKVEMLTNLRKQKEKLQSELHHVFEQLIVLNKKVRGCMPKIPTQTPLSEPQQQPKKETPPIVEAPLPPPQKNKTKLQLLEDELAAIESKLAALE